MKLQEFRVTLMAATLFLVCAFPSAHGAQMAALAGDKLAHELEVSDLERSSGAKEVGASANSPGSTSAPTVTGIRRNSDGCVTLEWTAQENHLYSVQGAEALQNGHPRTLTNRLPGREPITRYTISDATNASFFYWIEHCGTTNFQPGIFLISEQFDYLDGSLVTNSGSPWASQSGVLGQAQVASGKLQLTSRQTEDVNVLLAEGPYHPTNGNMLYASFTVICRELPTLSGNYFAHFLDAALAGEDLFLRPQTMLRRSNSGWGWRVI